QIAKTRIIPSHRSAQLEAGASSGLQPEPHVPGLVKAGSPNSNGSPVSARSASVLRCELMLQPFLRRSNPSFFEYFPVPVQNHEVAFLVGQSQSNREIMSSLLINF